MRDTFSDTMKASFNRCFFNGCCFASVKEINRLRKIINRLLSKGIKRLRKEINRLLRNFNFLSLKNLPPGEFF